MNDQANADAGRRAHVSKQPGRGPVLAHGEIEPAVAIEVSVGGAALLSVDRQAGALGGNRLQLASSLPKQQETTAGIISRRGVIGGEEILREEDVLFAVAVKVRNTDIECWSELGVRGQCSRLEPIAAIEEHRVIHRRRRNATRGGRERSDDLADIRVRIRSERAQTLARSR